MSNEDLFGQIAEELRSQTVTPEQNTTTPMVAEEI